MHSFINYWFSYTSNHLWRPRKKSFNSSLLLSCKVRYQTQIDPRVEEAREEGKIMFYLMSINLMLNRFFLQIL